MVISLRFPMKIPIRFAGAAPRSNALSIVSRALVLSVACASAGYAHADADVRAHIADQATDIATGTPEQFSALMRKDSQRWARLIREAGIKAE